MNSYENWNQQGSLYIWHYHGKARNFPGWHLHGDKEACDSIVDLTARMLVATYPVERSIRLVPERPVIVNPTARWSAASELRLVFVPDADDADHWQILYTNGKLILNVGKNKLIALQAGVAGIVRGHDDYAVGPEVDCRKMQGKERWRQERLWFWAVRPANR